MREKREERIEQNPLERTEAVLYARVSTRDQEKESFSIPAQIKRLEEWPDPA